MSLWFSVLASGSSGNSTVVRWGRDNARRHLLIDAGLSVRQTRLRLASLGISLEDLDALLLTHLDADHYHRGWGRLLARAPIQVHVHERHCRAAVRAGIPVTRLRVFQESSALGELRLAGVLLSHDQLGSVGYLLEHDGQRLGYATDLGRVPARVHEHFAGLHALALESNYDSRAQLESDRPPMLKRRIMGGNGHLSNEQALRAVLAISQRGALDHLVLLHLSRQCNDPRLVRRLYARRAPHLLPRLTIASQASPTPLLGVTGGAVPVGAQMRMF